MKHPTWKQKSPTDQLIAIRMAMEGAFDNGIENVISPEQFRYRMNHWFEQLELLQPFLEGKEQW